MTERGITADSARDGVITALAVQERDKGRVNVHLDGEFAFGLDLMMAAHLRVGDRLDAGEVERLLHADGFARAYQHALALIAGRPRSRAEVERRLRDKGYAPEAVAATLERLEANGYVDDAEFARYWAEQRTLHRPRSSRALRYELRRKGVEDGAIEEAVGGLDDEAAAWAALEPKLAQWQALPPEEVQKKASGFLARRGFGYDVIRRVLRRAGDEDVTEDE
jgi:regulatory protein